ncbi:hypothetical protein PVK06_044178 [Gossypium arboreum]|uniref:Uncharacterized protein n=1 Tax=Gossypium arboreum TaxID=29729 RepID=A0ABR0MQG1_GOSAR|nr:hypothetical protein PVK06_044178 [Gossypium arboreum]
MLNRAIGKASEFYVLTSTIHPTTNLHTVGLRWQPLEKDEQNFNTDGYAIRNSGLAGVNAIIRDCNGR